MKGIRCKGCKHCGRIIIEKQKNYFDESLGITKTTDETFETIITFCAKNNSLDPENDKITSCNLYE